MAQITITANVSGAPNSLGATMQAQFTAFADDVAEFTQEVDGSYKQIWAGSWSFFVAVNSGSTEFIVEITKGSSYITVAVAPGAQLVLPGSFGVTGANLAVGTVINIYTASGTTRGLFMIGFVNT